MGWGLYFLLYYLSGLRSALAILEFAYRHYGKDTFAVDVDENRSISYKELYEQASFISSNIISKVISQHQPVAFIGKNSIDYFLIRCASIISQRPFLALHHHLDRETISNLLASTNCNLLFYSSNIDTHQLPEDKDITVLDVRANSPINISKTQNKHTNRQNYTYNLSSATTARQPKIIKISERAWINSLYNYIRIPEKKARKKTSFLCMPPFSGAGSVTFLPMLLSGGRYIITKQTQPSDIYRVIEEESIDTTYMPPAFFSRFIAFCKQKGLRPACEIIVGSDRINPNAIKTAIQEIDLRLTVSYGMAEVLPPLTSYIPSQHDNFERLCSVGKVNPTANIQLDLSHNMSFKNKEIGRIKVKATTMADGYHNNSLQTKRAFREGWFLTNDFGRFDKYNYLHILGRDIEILTLNGRQFFSKEIEDAIAEKLEYILNMRCIDNSEGDLTIFIEEDSLLERDRNKTEIAHIIKRIVQKQFSVDCSVKFIDSLPTTFAGKIDLLELKRIAYGR